MVREYDVADHHKKSPDGTSTSTVNVLEKPCDSEESEESSKIYIEVKFVSRKESSVDTNYEDYYNQFTAEESLSEVKSNDEIGVDRAKLEDCCSSSISIGERPTSNTKPILQTGCEPNCNMQDLDGNKKSSPVTEFWYGYGGNIYFQPIMCKAVPQAIVKSAEQCQMHRLSKRSNFNIKKQTNSMDLCLDAFSSRSALDNTGTLRFIDNRRLGRTLMKDFLKYRVNGARVGNFVMSEEVKVRLCKGFVCRTTDKLASPTRASTYPVLPSSENSVYVKAAVTPNHLGNQEPCFDKVKRAHNRCEKKSRMPGSLESHDFFSVFPRMISHPHYIDKVPKKKEIAGKSLHLTTNSQTINKITLFPFIHPLDCKDRIARKSHSAAKLLLRSVNANEDSSIKHLEERYVADHLQEIEKVKRFKSSNFRDTSSEEQYAYESLFSYHNKKVSDDIAKARSLKTALVTNSLSSSHQRSKKRPTEDPSRTLRFEDLEPAGDGNSPKEKNLESVSKQKVKHSNMYVAGKELNFPGKPISLTDVQGNLIIPPEGRHPDIERKRIFTHVDENIILGRSQDNGVVTNDEVELISSSVDLTQHDAKAVNFEDNDGELWSIDFTSYEPLAAKDILPVDRCNIPAPQHCRLPVLGQKIPSKSM